MYRTAAPSLQRDRECRAMTPSARQSALLASAGRYLAGGGTGLFVLPPELNLVVARGEGCRVCDVAGREYIDYHLSSGPALLGHAHPAITERWRRSCPRAPRTSS